jgi:16S rRNA (guanine527-N7)-methyltransferase
MTETEAQHWLAERGWWDSPAADKLRRFVELVLEEADRQNLISAGSREHIWARHIVDSAQLLQLAPRDSEEGLWIDLGAGAGFPGLVIACLRDAPIKLIEMRPLRVAFLEHCAEQLGLSHVNVVPMKVEKASNDSKARIISARAYAPLDRLLRSAIHLADEKTVWLLPKGRSGEKELENVGAGWQATFHVEHSITDPESVIVTISGLREKITEIRRSHRGGDPRAHARASATNRR